MGVGPNAYQAICLLGLKGPYDEIATHDPGEAGRFFAWRWGEKSKVVENGGNDEIGSTPCYQEGGHTTIHR